MISRDRTWSMVSNNSPSLDLKFWTAGSRNWKMRPDMGQRVDCLVVIGVFRGSRQCHMFTLDLNRSAGSQRGNGI